MTVLRRMNVGFRADQPPLIAIFTCAMGEHRIASPGEPARTFRIRGEDGRWTDEYLAMRRDMGTVVWNRP